jgi:hypothetical protein
VLEHIFGTRLATIRGTRAIDMGSLLDTIMVFAVATILIIRTQLWLSNYPQLGGHGLHIAHLLWGGLGMLIAIGILVSFLSPVARQIGAVLGGIGLGFFIDELGKFLTSDNNYFFKPTAAIIYIFFILFYLVVRGLQRRSRMTQRERLINTMELAKDAAGGTMTADEQERARSLLAQADQSDPMVAKVTDIVESAKVLPAARAPVFVRVGLWLRDRYFRVTARRWFVILITVIFVLWALSTLIEIFSLIATYEPHLAKQKAVKIRDVVSRGGHFGVVEWANIVSSIVGGVLVIWGLLLIRRSRARAYAMFEKALLISIFFTQVFAFIQSQFGAVIGLLIDLLLFYTVRFMLARERELELEGSPPPRAQPGPAAPATQPA